MSAVGLYSVVSYTVVQRTNEFGIRMALGATRNHVLRIVASSMLGSVGGGLVAGTVLSAALSRVMTHWTAGTASAGPEPLLLLGASLTLALVALLACLLPARRAAQVDPMIAIRAE